MKNSFRLPSLIKLRRNSRYAYTPRYYDERQEKLEALKSKYGESSPEILRIKLREKFAKNRNVRSMDKSANKRTFYILIILVALAYFALTKLGISLF